MLNIKYAYYGAIDSTIVAYIPFSSSLLQIPLGRKWLTASSRCVTLCWIYGSLQRVDFTLRVGGVAAPKPNDFKFLVILLLD